MSRLIQSTLRAMMLIAGAMCCIMPSYAQLHLHDDIQPTLDALDSEIARRHIYIDSRERSIDSLRVVLDESSRDTMVLMQSLMQLADRYVGYKADSAIVNYDRGYDIATLAGDRDMAMRFRLKCVSVMPVVGFMAEAVDNFEAIDIDSLPPDMQRLALESGRQMYSYLASFYTNYPDESSRWNDKSIALQKRLIDVTEAGSPINLLNQGEYYYLTGRRSEAKATLIELLDSIGTDSNMAARATHMLSDIALRRGEEEEAVYYLALSALADLRSATLEVMSLQELGTKLYEKGDVARAYNYLSVALENAVRCHAALRMLQTSESIPVIGEAHKAQLDRNRRILYVVLAFLIIVALGLAGALFMLRHEMAKMRSLQKNLASANKVKEMYMSQFLNLCTVYMDKLNQFCKIVSRKISTGHTDELYRLTKSGRFAEEQSREFYDTFDRAFLHIYPTFVSDVNALLREGDKIELGENELLNTDLRILAFMRLGVEEGTRIAQVLNYSVNTIYAYRNRLRNRAVNRESFERDVMSIGRID